MVFSGAANKDLRTHLLDKTDIKALVTFENKGIVFLMFMINLILGLLFSRTVVKLMN